MTSRQNRTPRGDSGRSERQQVGPAGWDLSAAEEEELFLRRTAFAVLAVAIVGVAGWFVVLTVRSSGSAARPLTTLAPATYTVKVLELDASKRNVAEQLVRSAAVRALAAEHEVYTVDLPQGRLAICVGRFERADSPEAQQLAERFAQFRVKDTPLFAASKVWKLPENK